MTTLPMLLSTNEIRANIETCGSWLERIFRNAFHIIISIDRQVHCFKCTYIHSFTHSFIHLFIHSFIYWVFIHSFVYVSFYLLIDFSVILPTPSHLVLCSINSLNSIINDYSYARNCHQVFKKKPCYMQQYSQVKQNQCLTKTEE